MLQIYSSNYNFKAKELEINSRIVKTKDQQFIKKEQERHDTDMSTSKPVVILDIN